MISAPTSILAFRNGSIGNTLVAVPAMRALKRSYPAARLTVVVDFTGHELLKHTPWIDELIIYDKRGQGRGLIPHIRLVRKLHSMRPSHAVLFKRFFRNGLLAYLSGAKVRAGFLTDGKAPFLTMTIPYDESINIVDLNLRLAELLGAAASERALELSLSDEDRAGARRVLADRDDPGRPYIVAHYGGQTTPPDFFSVERFATLIHGVSGTDHDIFLIGSGHREVDLAERLSKLIPKARNAVGLPIRTTAALIESAALFIGFNSGPAHMASAVKTPSMVFFQPGDKADRELRKWAPIGPEAISLVPPHKSEDSAWETFLLATVPQARSGMRKPAVISH